MARFNPRWLTVITPQQAVRELEMVASDGCGVSAMAPKMLSRCIKLNGLKCHQANILKQELLSVGGDAAVARGTVACSIPATDCILIGTDKQLQRLCHKLAAQPFGLAALAEELSAVLKSSAHPPRIWRTSLRDLSLERPLIMGILNITPDSFSDGGCFDTPEKALEQALQMEAEGADIIDIGGESSRPGAAAVPHDQELARVMPTLELLAGKLTCAISVDTWKSTVADQAMNTGAEIINDISGLNFDPEMATVAARHNAGVVLMHTRGTPDRMQQDTDYTDLMREVTESLQSSVAQALEAGIARERIAVDPGIGFGKECSGNLEILRRLDELRTLGLPVLVGSSRKSFIGKVLGRTSSSDRLFGTAATVAIAVHHGASILRVHDVRAMRDVADMARAVMLA
jgi:dihydropteroate synthase